MSGRTIFIVLVGFILFNILIVNFFLNREGTLQKCYNSKFELFSQKLKSEKQDNMKFQKEIEKFKTLSQNYEKEAQLLKLQVEGFKNLIQNKEKQAETKIQNIVKEKLTILKEIQELKNTHHHMNIDHHPISFDKRNYSFFDCKPPSHPNRYPFYRPYCLSNDLEIQKEETRRLFRECPYLKGQTATIYKNNDGFSIPFHQTFKIFEEFIYCQVPFGFMRFGDGEQLLMGGYSLGSDTQAYRRDKWTWKGGKGRLSKDLEVALGATGNFFYGLPCPNGFIEALRISIEKTSPLYDSRYFSYSTMFLGTNLYHFNHFMNDILEHKLPQSVILVINHSSKEYHDQLLKFAHEIVYVIDDGPTQYEEHKGLLLSQMKSLAKSHSNCLFLLAAGPLAKIFVYEMWKTNKCNQYVDVGSAIIPFIKGSKIDRKDISKSTDYVCDRYKFDQTSKKVISKKESDK